jgi:hypothetical protein
MVLKLVVLNSGLRDHITTLIAAMFVYNFLQYHNYDISLSHIFQFPAATNNLN